MTLPAAPRHVLFLIALLIGVGAAVALGSTRGDQSRRYEVSATVTPDRLTGGGTIEAAGEIANASSSAGIVRVTLILRAPGAEVLKRTSRRVSIAGDATLTERISITLPAGAAEGVYRGIVSVKDVETGETFRRIDRTRLLAQSS